MSKEKKMNTKAKVLLSSVLLLSLGLGSTYSWFTSQTSPVEQKMQMGTLSIASTMNSGNPDVYTNLQPGDEFSLTGNIENNGTLPAIIAARVESSDPIAGYTATFVPSGTAEGDQYVWLQDKLNPSNYYLYLAHGEKIKGMEIEITLDGNTIGDEFQSATLNQVIKANATQSIPAAMLSVLNIDINNLEPVSPKGLSEKNHSDYIKKGHDILDKIKHGK